MPASLWGQALLVPFWGLAFGGGTVAWSNWVSRAVPDQAESAGGMVVASVQSSIAAGAAAGREQPSSARGAINNRIRRMPASSPRQP
ncbi:hypothetical protein G6F59_014587 [Rhizopus arrhizus]|nr:hypothetical protein G6F59_014587 [Rhizopus arrhizus]